MLETKYDSWLAMAFSFSKRRGS